MEWYWWVLIALGLAIFAYVKIKVTGKVLNHMKRRQEEKERRMEDND